MASLPHKLRRATRNIPLSWSQVWLTTRRTLLVTVGSILAALGFVLFQVPFDLAAGGTAGLALIINHFTGWSVGLLYLISSAPLIWLGYVYLGRWRFLTYTLMSVLIFATATDVFMATLPDMFAPYPLTSDLLLSSIYAGIIGGIGGGLVIRAGGTRGGTSVLGRVIQLRTGIPLSQAYLFTDGLIVLAAGMIFDWEIALCAMLVMFLNGIASDFVLEGPSTIRTATIVTNRPRELIPALIEGLQRGVSYWQVQGGYTDEIRSVVFCTVYRTQIHELKRLVGAHDPQAFVVIGDAHQAFGSSFLPLKPPVDELPASPKPRHRVEDQDRP